MTRAGPARRVILLRSHAAFLVVFTAGAVLRLLSTLAYHPALQFPDTARYLVAADTLRPDDIRPLGYSAFLRLLYSTGTVAAVPIVQHLLGLGLVVACYAFLLRRGAPRWVAVLASAPLALDAYLVQIEEYVLAETLFLTLLLVALGALLWRGRPAYRNLVVAGLLLAAAGLTRTAGLPLIGLAVGYLIARRVGWRRVGAFTLVCALPVIGYATYYHSAHGQYAVSGYSGRFLHGRVAPLADCTRLPALTAQERVLCESTPPQSRTTGSEWYDWNRSSPAVPYRNPHGDRVLASFARKVIEHQPLDYARLVGGDIVHYFLPGRWVTAQDACQDFWQFRGDAPRQLHVCSSGAVKVGWLGPLAIGFDRHRELHGVNPGLARLLRDYQVVGYTPGPLLALCLIALPVHAIRRRQRSPDPRRCWDACLLAGSGLMLVAVPSATAVFDYRYGLQLVALLPLAAGVALTGRRRPTPAPPTVHGVAAPTAPEATPAGRSVTTG